MLDTAGYSLPTCWACQPPSLNTACRKRLLAAPHAAPQGTVTDLKARACALFKVQEVDVTIWDYFQHNK